MTNEVDDFKLWFSMVKDVKKLNTKAKVATELKPLPKLDPYKAKPLPQIFAPKNSKNLIDLEINNSAGIDYSTNRKIVKGEYVIDGTLDLHGKTQEQAFLTLTKFIEEAYHAQKRLLLVIVGKGKQSENNHGLLRGLVPHWVNHPSLRHLIIGIKTAAPKHGGDGAIYILLKRIRNDSNYKTKSTSKTYKV
ncbi:hypothetical protein I862_01445 [endosymbiont of Acanthamoeba sp. UWC8]|uniref:Smr/MutS family protein n=1 Tax=endosymbiont of Acanthamoeba sp. UWC8 TaxID=86106 RepID=UPI0004D19C40|nr:Smr/MutS family protein [endosymbiont of Acanthamoeba sp. UWC8]AIF80852.1 hypothetical protein I862_01445 [endosymbiont of Acanthamoeba sp. UWC8]